MFQKTLGLFIATALATSGSTQAQPAQVQQLAPSCNATAGYTKLYTAAQFTTSISANLGGSFFLCNDIDMATLPGPFTPLGSWQNRFTGVLDGNGKTIRNLTISLPATQFAALFAVSEGTIRRLYLTNVNVNGSTMAASLVGSNRPSGRIESVSVTGQVSGSSNVGGMVGENYGEIYNAIFNGSVRGVRQLNSTIGGLVGGNVGRIERGFSLGTVSGHASIGGLVGRNGGSVFSGEVIIRSASAANVDAQQDAGGLVAANVHGGNVFGSFALGNVFSSHSSAGGLVGHNSAFVLDCFARGAVATQAGDAGGLVGQNALVIQDSYSTGSVVDSGMWGSMSGGLVGYTITSSWANPSVTRSFWDTQTSGVTTSDGGLGKTTLQMKSVATYAGWDISPLGTTHQSAWKLAQPDGTDYPLMHWLYQ